MRRRFVRYMLRVVGTTTRDRRFNLREARINEGLSHEALATRLGVSHNTLRRIEDGGLPQPRVAKLIADYYRRRVSDIWPSL